MKIKINRELKIILLQALKDGYIETADIRRFETGSVEYDFSYLTDEETEQLLRIGEKVLEYECKNSGK
jgi:hypothetical protein